MSLTDTVLVIFIILLLVWALYDEIITGMLREKTLLKIILLRRNRIDSAIFIFLIGILIYNNITTNGSLLTTWLLSVLALTGIYISWIRQPKLLFKTEGFFFTNIWIEYQRIKAMNLSEDGVLVIQLEHRRLLIRVKNIDDLEKISKLMLTTQ